MKKALIIILIIVLVIALYYVAMLISTNSLVDYFKDVVKGNIPETEIADTPLHQYYVADEDDFKYADVSITRAFVIHNFFDGYMWIDYDIKAYDENDEITSGSATSFPCGLSRWKIHRENGEWKVVEIDEAP